MEIRELNNNSSRLNHKKQLNLEINRKQIWKTLTEKPIDYSYWKPNKFNIKKFQEKNNSIELKAVDAEVIEDDNTFVDAEVIEDDGTFVDVEVIEDDDTYRMNSYERSWFNSSPKTEKARICLDKNNIFKPQNKIDLWNWNFLFVSDKIIIKDWRPIIIWYSMENWLLNLRLFYRSNSEWCWRACPWKRSIGGYSKWEFINNYSYETTTKIDGRVWKAFDSLNQVTYDGDPINDISNEISNKRHESLIKMWHEILEEEMKASINVDVKLFKDNTSAADFYEGKKTSKVIKWYSKCIPLWLDYKHMENNQEKTYSYKHDYLWYVNVQVFTMKWNWIYLDFHFARAENSPTKVRIENVVRSDAKINSFWVYDKQVNAWPLVAKPIDYVTQVPKNRNGDRYWDSYMDIRDLYQWNPIIQWYKNIAIN